MAVHDFWGLGMNLTETLFVVGAGASHEVGLPLGSTLTGAIASKLDIRFEPFDKMIGGSHRIFEALKIHVSENGGDIGSLQTDCCWAIRDAMPQALSIDSFVDSHRDNEGIEICSKLGISESILVAERESKLFVGDGRDDKPDFGAIDGTWYEALFHRIHDRCNIDELPDRLASIAFIVFNYDRCVEHFLFHAIRNFYRVEKDRAAELLAPLKIYHPFGVVGKLPWQGGDQTTPFGATHTGGNLLAIANGIKTISETSAVQDGAADWSEALGAAQRVVFLGFAFHPQNMLLLRPAETSNQVRKRIFATAHGISDTNQELARASIKHQFGSSVDQGQMYVRGDLKCAGLFDVF